MRRTSRGSLENNQRLTRRAMILGGAQIGVMGVLALRLRQMQILDADVYRMLAEENRISLQLIAPERGRILDRNGAVLADNQPTYQITIVRELAGDMTLILGRLQALLPTTDIDVERVLAESEKTSAFVPITVADGVTWDNLARIAINTPALPGVTPQTVQQRYYPLGPDFAHTIGYVGRVSPDDMEEAEGGDPLLSMPGFKIGKISIEKRSKPN